MPEPCTKRRFRGVKDARLAFQRAGFRVRVYSCDHCGGYHVTNDEKHGHQRDRAYQREPRR